jgi:hypothetical protein
MSCELLSSGHSSSFSKYFQVMRKNWGENFMSCLKARHISPGISVLKVEAYNFEKKPATTGSLYRVYKKN